MDKELKQNLLEAVTEKLPALAVESTKRLISENERLTTELENEKAQHENVKHQLEQKTARVRKLEKLQLKEEELNAREEQQVKKTNELEVARLTYELQAEKEKTSSINGLVSTLFQNKNISHFVSMNGTAALPDGGYASINLSGSKEEV